MKRKKKRIVITYKQSKEKKNCPSPSQGCNFFFLLVLVQPMSSLHMIMGDQKIASYVISDLVMWVLCSLSFSLCKTLI